MSALGEGDAFLHEIEVEVRAELTIAETSRKRRRTASQTS